MINAALDIGEWVLLGVFLLSAFNIRFIGLLMAANIGLGMVLYSWFVEIPPEAASIIVGLINFSTIGLILKFGEKNIQRLIQPVILLGFVVTDMLLLSGLIYDSFEMWLALLYGLMFVTISWDGWHGARICILATGDYYTVIRSNYNTGIK